MQTRDRAVLAFRLAAWALLFIFIVLGLGLLATIQQKGENPPLVVAAHVHSLGLAIVMLLMGYELPNLKGKLRDVSAALVALGSYTFVFAMLLGGLEIIGMGLERILSVFGSSLVGGGMALFIAVFVYDSFWGEG